MRILLLLLISQSAFSYVISRSETGAEVKWKRSNKTLNLYINPYPVSNDITLDISDDELDDLGMTESNYIASRMIEIMDEATDQWNEVSPYTIKPIYQTSTSVSFNDSSNSMAFTNNFSFFNSGVLAVTVLSYESDSGSINSADILINQSATNFVDFTVDEDVSSLDAAYLGDVLTHEIGHMLGLSHSEVTNSTMTYSVFKNQHTIHTDDEAGVIANYNLSTYDGQIEGTVVADTGEGVFGAHVLLVSLTENKVVQGQITDADGKFSFQVEDSNKSYSILVKPLKNLSSLPDYYKNVKTDYCSQDVFVPSFFQACGGRSKSRPHQMSPENQGNYIDVGEVTIRCDEGLDSNYLANKFSSAIDPIELDTTYAQTTANFVGLFFDDEIEQGVAGNGDSFSFDLSDISSGSDVVRISVMTTSLGSRYKIVTAVQKGSNNTVAYTAGTDETGKLLTDYSIDFSLSTDITENIFNITLYPSELSTDEAYEIFSAPNELANSNNIYQLVVSVGSYVDGEFIPRESIDSYPYTDNSSCREGTLSYGAKPYTSFSSTTNAAASSEDQGFSCATVDLGGDDGGNSSGPMSFVLGILIVVLSSRFRYYFLSKP